MDDENLKYWLDCIREWYPDRHNKAYFLPPVFFRRKNYGVAVIAQQPVLIPEIPKKRLSNSPTENVPHYPHEDYKPSVSSKPLITEGVCSVPQGEPAPLHQPKDSDALNDDAAEHVLRCLKALSEQCCSKEGMMVMSELEFCKLPRPDSIKSLNGDFDLLIIHRHHGLIACEVKAVGTYSANLEDKVVEKVDDAKKQLVKAKEFLTGIVEDMGASKGVSITKTIILPNVTSAEVMHALKNNPECEQNLYECVDSVDMPGAMKRCLCKDQLPSTEDLNSLESHDCDASYRSSTLSAISDWWKEITASTMAMDPMPEESTMEMDPMPEESTMAMDPMPEESTMAMDPMPEESTMEMDPMPEESTMEMDPMPEELYDKFLARFCGPAATVEVFSVAVPRKLKNANKRSTNKKKYTLGKKAIKTSGDAIAESGLIMSTLTLYPNQVSLVLAKFNCVHLYGPPGTGKTVVLYMKGCQWLDQGHDVHVCSLTEESLAVSFVLLEQLRKYRERHLPSDCHPIVYHCNLPEEFSWAETAVDNNRELYVIADEVMNVTTGRPQDDPQCKDRGRFEKFASTLYTMVPSDRLSVWCASMEKMSQDKPDWLQEKQLTTPLRSPPAVTREVAKSAAMLTDQYGTVPPYSCDSTTATAAVNELPVKWLNHSEHESSRNAPMYCGACGDIIVKLLEEYNVGKDDDSLQYRDVFILCSTLPDSSNSRGGIVNALQSNGIPITVLKRKDNLDFFYAVLGRENKVIISDYRTVAGLERRVVIGMGVKMGGEEMPNRLMAMSRCSGQLVWIGKPTKA